MIREFYRFKQKKAQITTLFVVVLGALLLFTSIFVDLAKVSFTKTRLNIAVDSGASMLGSLLTSQAKMLSDGNMKGELFHTKKGGFFSGCLWGVICVILIIVGIVLSISNPLYSFMVAVGAWGLNQYFNAQEVLKALGESISALSTGAHQIRESTLLTVMKGIVDDPVKVIDLCDINQNSSTKDWVSRFDVFLDERERALAKKLNSGRGDLKRAVREIREQLRYLKEEENNLTQFRNFLKDGSLDSSLGLWEIFPRILNPGYDQQVFGQRITDVESYHRYEVGGETKQLAFSQGYSVNNAIWDSSDSVDSDEIPKNENLREISKLIYEIYYTDEDSRNDSHFQAYLDRMLSYSSTELVRYLDNWRWPVELYDGTEGAVWDPVKEEWNTDRCDWMLRWAEWIENWQGELKTKKSEVDVDVAIVQEEIRGINRELDRVTATINRLNAEMTNLTMGKNEIIAKEKEVLYQISNIEFHIRVREITIAGLEALANPTAEERDALIRARNDLIRLSNDYSTLEAEATSLNSQVKGIDNELSAKSTEVSVEENYYQALFALRQHLENNVQLILTNLSQDIGGIDGTLNNYKLSLNERRNYLQERAKIFANYYAEEKEVVTNETLSIQQWYVEIYSYYGSGKMLYAWKDTRGWHLAKVVVGKFTVPWIDEDLDEHISSAELELRLQPYYGGNNEGETVPIQAWRFDESFSGAAGLWKFYPSKKYDTDKWEKLKQGLEKELVSAGTEKELASAKTLVDEKNLYIEVNNFLTTYGIAAQANSYTEYVDRQNEESRWAINIVDTK